MFDIGSAVAHIKVDLSEFKKGLEEAKSQASGVGSAIGSIGSGIADFGQKAAIMTGVVATGLGVVGKMGLEYAGKFEQYQIAFTTLLGTQEKAAAAIKNIQNDAAKTPFELAPLVMANQRLISAGVNAEDARADILNLGDAISATGGGNAELERLSTNLQQIKAVGKATALDIKQFAFAGINIYDMLAKSTGKTVAEVKEMDVSYEILADSFDKAAGKGGMFHDAMKNQSRSLNGLFSTLKDTVMLGLKDILMGGGLFDAIRSSVEGLIPYLQDVAVPGIINFFNRISLAVRSLISFFQGEKESLFDFFNAFIPDDAVAEQMYNLFGPLFDALKSLGEWIMANKETVITFLQGLAVAFGALLIIGSITALVTALLNPLVLVALGIAALYTAWQTNFFGIRDITTQVVTYVVDFFNNYFLPVIMMVINWFNENWTNLTLTFQGLWNIIVGVVQMSLAIILTAVKVFLAIMSGDWDAAWKAIKDGVDMFFSGFHQTLMGAIDYIRGWGGLLIHNLVQPFEEAWNKISDFLGKIKDGLDFTKRHSPSVVDIVKKGVNEVNSALDGLAINQSINSQQVAGMSGTSKSIGNIQLAIDMSGAMIGDSFSAQRMGQKMGDEIVKRLQQNIRF